MFSYRFMNLIAGKRSGRLSFVLGLQTASGRGWMNDLLKQVSSLSLVGKCVGAVVGILVIHAAFRVLERTLPRRFGRADARYKVRKFVVFSGYLSTLLLLTVLFGDRLG